MFKADILGETLKDGIEALTIIVDEARVHLGKMAFTRETQTHHM